MGFFITLLDKRTVLLLWRRPGIPGRLFRRPPVPDKKKREQVCPDKAPAAGFLEDRISFDEVTVEDLHKRLGFPDPLEYPRTSREKPLTKWKMEIDDSPIFRYLYRNFKPGRHLEFGTWQGTGVLYCLEECDATVWTINIPEGQTESGGDWAYANCMYDLLPQWAKDIPEWVTEKIFGGVRYQTDAIGMIGRYYLEKKLGGRVCQIYCDSRDWDVSNYPASFFDSVLIDGGHSADVVMNDTRKALGLVRPGGLVMWHDFCPDKKVYNAYQTNRGVYTALAGNYGWLTSQMKDLFWINPSWILAGIKN